jgi:hypothetical protein
MANCTPSSEITSGRILSLEFISEFVEDIFQMVLKRTEDVEEL